MGFVFSGISMVHPPPSGQCTGVRLCRALAQCKVPVEGRKEGGGAGGVEVRHGAVKSGGGGG